MDSAQLNQIGIEVARQFTGKLRVDEISFGTLQSATNAHISVSGFIRRGSNTKQYSLNAEQVHKLLSYPETQIRQFLVLF